MLSVAQVWTAYVEKESDQVQKGQEFQLAQLQKDRELISQEERDLRDFISKNEDSFFSTNKAEQDKKLKVMLTTFPVELVQPVITKLAEMSPQESLTEASNQVRSILIKESRPLVYIQHQGKADEQLADGLIQVLSEMGYRVPGKELVVQATKGDVRFFHADEQEETQSLASTVHDYLKQKGHDHPITPIFAGRTFTNIARGIFEIWIPKESS